MADKAIPPTLISRKAAITAGLKRYFTGKPCKRGHVVERDVSSSSCVTCRDDRGRAWYAAHPTRAKDNRERWRADNREKDLASKRAYAAKHREHLKRRAKERYRADKPRHAKLTRAWKDAHPEELVVHAYNARARKCGWQGPFMTLEIYRFMVKQQAGCCAYCRRDDRKLVFDHVLAIARGGGHGPDNTLFACQRCNATKGVGSLVDFLEWKAKTVPGWITTVADVEQLLDVPWRRIDVAA